MSYNVYIDGAIVATHKEPLTRKKTLKEVIANSKRIRRDGRLVKALAR